jgi:transitional endoplasmic reticulum ATPase
MLTEMDGLEELTDVIILGATNRPDLIDASLLRPGRFDRIIATTVPNKKSRKVILEIHTKDMPLAKDVDLSKLVEKTESFTGADLAGMCKEAAMLALRSNKEAKEVSMEHFEEALKKLRPSLREEDIKKYKDIEESYLRKARASKVIPAPTYLG